MAGKIVLIGGAPGAGKTTLGRALAARLGVTSLTVDDLAMGIRAVTTLDSHPAFHVMPDGHLEYFTTGPPEKLIGDARALELAIWPAVERLIRFRLRAGQGIVIDWWLLPPHQVAALGAEGVQSLWLHIDPEALERRELADTGFREGSSDPERMHTNFMARSRWRNQLIADEAASRGLPLLHQTGDVSPDQLIEKAIQKLDWHLGG